MRGRQSLGWVLAFALGVATATVVWALVLRASPPAELPDEVIPPWSAQLEAGVRAGSEEGALALPRPKQVIVLGLDTVRADHVSSYGYPRATTPNLDRRMGEEGVIFERAYASSSWTLPSMASLFTSLQPVQHRVEDRGHRLDPGVPTLAGAFSSQGWLSAGFATHIYVSSLFGLDSGFLEFRELSIDWRYREGGQLRADALNGYVLPWIEHHREQPFFLYVHYFDPHWDYDPPAPFDSAFTDPMYLGVADGTWKYIGQFIDPGRRMDEVDLAEVGGLYDGELAFTDAQLEVLFSHLEALGLYEDSLIVVLSDHGEELQDHGSMHHIRTLYEEVIRVPLLVKLPGGRPRDVRARVPERVRSIDIAPTILELAGLEIPKSFQGRSFASLLVEPGESREVFARTVRHGSDKVALIQGRWKLVYSYGKDEGRTELYDLEADPKEQHSLAEGPEQARAEAMRRELMMRVRAMEAGNDPDTAPGRVDLTPDQEAHLRALGYVQ